MNYSKVVFSIASGIVDVVVVMATSTFGYLVKGPLAAEWDWRTQLSRDVLVYWSRHPERSKRAREALKAIQQLLESLPWTIGYTRTQYMVPGFSIDKKYLPNSGIWAERLKAASEEMVGGTRPALLLDRIISTRIERSVAHRKAVLYLHGGAFVSGGRYDNLPVARRLSTSTAMPVFLLEYRLAPETKYPGQLYDAFCALCFLTETLGYSIGDIVLAGDSAGGNLALALWQLTRQPVGALVLLSPRVDVVSMRGSWKSNIAYDILPIYDIEQPGNSLALLLEQDDRQRLGDPFLAPIHALALDGLPPTLVQAGSREAMLDDIREFVRRLRCQKQTRLVFTEYAGGFHVFQAAPFGAVNGARAWKQVEQFVLCLKQTSPEVSPSSPLA
ncbi:hypothetical protein LPJ64_002564 [Coemansia asiatica]|uniref:Alpha/beta hydrolase fold-3 domain-containing protein n=1 Tax=Coemansia asiatica TaxID=1052880 RepID=A0A9W7XJE5_9FUNG|nr:hypothetical protein LPJ64_002564 [Coemansia asiatica]